MKIAMIRFVNVILAALLAGTSFGIWMGFNPSYYSSSTYVEQQQHLILSLHTLMLSLVILATLVSLFSAYMHRKNKADFILLILAGVAFISCIYISWFGNYPIQMEMLRWRADTLPANWMQLRDDWWHYHIMRTIAELIALVLVVWISVKQQFKFTSPRF